MAGEAVSTTELEGNLEEARNQWNLRTQGVITIRGKCTNCWRNEGVHQNRAMDSNCTLRKLTPSEYFKELVHDVEQSEKAALLYSKGTIDHDVMAQMEHHINQLVVENSELRERYQRPRRRRRGVDASGWATVWDESETSEGDEASVEDEQGAAAAGAPGGEWKDFRVHTQMEAGLQEYIHPSMLSHVNNAARSRRRITGGDGT